MLTSYVSSIATVFFWYLKIYQSDRRMSEGAISESYGSSDLERDYLLSEGKLIRLSDPKPTKLVTLSTFFRSVFLPQGYPDSVSGDYLEYQVWDTVQAFSSSITSSLATQAVLKGVGVGDDSATVAAATVTWLLKDGTGMLGRIAFAWFKGSHLDCDCKKWRLFADVLNDVAIFLDILAPHFGSAFRGIVCFSGILRAVVGVAGGATRAAITQHQARRNNMADVAAKDGSQETLVNLMGLLCSLLLIPLISGKMMLIWVFFSFFTTTHLLANYMAVTCIVIEIFNQSRLHIVASQFFISGVCPTVKETNYAEPVLLDSKRLFAINLGCSLEKNLKRAGSYRVTEVISSKMYLIGLDPQQSAININLHRDSSFADQLRSCFHAELIEFCFRNSKKISILQQKLQTQDLTINHLISLISRGHIREMLAESEKIVDASWNHFADMALNAGWKLSPNLLGADEWRIK